MPSKISISHTEKGNYCRMPYMCRSKKTGQTKVSHSIMSKSLGPHGLYRPWNCPGQNTGVGCHALLQGIFPTQGLNPGLPHCRQILYHLSHQGKFLSSAHCRHSTILVLCLPFLLNYGAHPPSIPKLLMKIRTGGFNLTCFPPFHMLVYYLPPLLPKLC